MRHLVLGIVAPVLGIGHFKPLRHYAEAQFLLASCRRVLLWIVTRPLGRHTEALKKYRSHVLLQVILFTRKQFVYLWEVRGADSNYFRTRGGVDEGESGGIYPGCRAYRG